MTFRKISLQNLIFALSFMCFSALSYGGEIINLNKDWKFTYGYEVRKGVYDVVSLPHTWNNKDATSGKNNYYRGLGNYEKELEIPSEWATKRLFLKFHGANTVANVFVNGEHVGEHRGGYTAFTFEITDKLKPGEKNRIQVRVNNAPQLDVMPLLGDFNMYGGIYRDVELLVENQNSISPLHYGSNGIYLKQENVTYKNADVNAEVKLLGEPGSVLNTEISLFSDKNLVLKSNKKATLNAEGKATANIPFSVKNPRLWDGTKDPFMYRAKVKVFKDGKIVDEAEVPLGLRFFHVDPDKGFFLNGEHLQLKGVSRHQDRPELGNAIHPQHHREDVAIMQDMGANAVRLSHYPQDPYMYGLLNKAGLVVWSEIPFVGPGGYRDKGFVNQASFKENGRTQLKEMIYQQYNHPSIMFWGLFNELKETGDNPINYVKELQQLTKKLDPSRITTSASNQTGDLNRITDIISWNLYFGWYGGTPDAIGDWADKKHEKYPNTPIGISEYGAGASIYHQQEELKKPNANSYWHPENWQTHFHEEHWIAIDQRPFLWGTFIWNLFDFGAAHRTEGEIPGKNDKGLVTFDRSTKKDAYYFYKANWNKEDPMVYIAEKRLKRRSNELQTIKVYSNSKKIELFHNGKSLGKKSGNYGRFIWEQVKLHKGENKLTAKTKNGLSDEIIITKIEKSKL
ncbi:beta-galactosidase [Salegentibacter echinorum]|uniref:Beta-galactosidase n=1 Tax=Salegentibacter echinorum TaxID=1073325 RepID=A0A1M5C9K2_SALEC|nr:glycoside hydrolase family 2 TIM barrel-domain containing protein [Salegentibacter echinorum]SHF51429.1 beta-galactosidase [Salegentibacter echinorum]